eukprot:TRINITY_DN8066_c0_g1_i1.p1 TRINITY_DN8066_c0_g1~~TRINITY_DN8066_c0_g1_i1.p1  ORF type:complete len:146 (-),score=22.32 TRINITY_DN8066_c0_g1_i1:28-405(-)
MDSISAQQQGAYELFQVLQGLQESYMLAGEDNGRLMQVLEKLAGELPEEDLQRLQWAMSMLGYHVLGNETLRPSGIMLTPVVQRMPSTEEAPDLETDDADIAEQTASQTSEDAVVIDGSTTVESV